MASPSTPLPNNQQEIEAEVEKIKDIDEQVEEISKAVDGEQDDDEEKMDPKERQADAKESMPEWVHSMLRRNFFGACPIHDIFQKNDLNKYCITCDVEACKYCMSSGFHDEHEVLKIHRHVYKDVVSFDEMDEHFDCERVQPYKCNKKWVVSLHPLPHCGSGALCEVEASCEICKRKLGDPKQYRFCCISCKVQAFYKSIGETPPFLLQSRHMSDLMRTARSESSKRKRKGIPERAPFH